jgi:hypothetical protein
MWIWVLVTWSVISLLPARAPGRPAYAIAAVAGVAFVALLGFRTRGHAVNPDEYRPSGSLMAQIRERAPEEGPVQIVSHSFGFDSSAIYALRREGLDVGTPDARELGTSYAPEGRRFHQVIEITESDRRPPPRARVIATATMQSSPPRTIRAFLEPPGGQVGRPQP